MNDERKPILTFMTQTVSRFFDNGPELGQQRSTPESRRHTEALSDGWFLALRLK